MKPWIKRSLIALTGITIAVGGLTACGTRGHHEHGPMSAERMSEMRGKVIDRVTKKLDLNAEQQQKLGVLADKLQAQRTAFIGQTADPRAEVRQLVAGDKFDRARALSLLDEKDPRGAGEQPRGDQRPGRLLRQPQPDAAGRGARDDAETPGLGPRLTGPAISSAV